MTYAERAFARTRHTQLPDRHRHVILAAALLFDDGYEFVTSRELSDATGILRPSIITYAGELARDHLLVADHRGAAYVYRPGPALTHAAPTEGHAIEHLVDRTTLNLENGALS